MTKRYSLGKMVELAEKATEWELIDFKGYPETSKSFDAYFSSSLSDGRELIFGVSDSDMIEGTFDKGFFRNQHFDSTDANEDRYVVDIGYGIYVAEESTRTCSGKKFTGKYEIELENHPELKVPKSRRKKSFEQLRDVYAKIKSTKPVDNTSSSLFSRNELMNLKLWGLVNRIARETQDE